MFKSFDVKYSYNDVMIVPSELSEINSRSECNPFDENGMLPIFAAPMTSVVNLTNYEIFQKNYIYPILPRNIDFDIRYTFVLQGKWVAFSLNEFIDTFCDENKFDYGVHTMYALIDIANGHMKKMYDAVKKAKLLYGNKLKVMIGNIANPETYFECYKAGADYCRFSIGSGQGCITSSNVSIHYPIASLLYETYLKKKDIFNTNNYLNRTWEEMPKIIADGGIRNFSDIQKALALGADYVMCGGILSQLIESAGRTFTDNGTELFPLGDDKVSEDNGKFISVNANRQFSLVADKLYKKFYGMASKQGQIDINGSKTKTSEGILKMLPVTTNIYKWIDNAIAYLRSAMSYCNVKELKDFNPENVDTIIISNNTKDSINK